MLILNCLNNKYRLLERFKDFIRFRPRPNELHFDFTKIKSCGKVIISIEHCCWPYVANYGNNVYLGPLDINKTHDPVKNCEFFRLLVDIEILSCAVALVKKAEVKHFVLQR